MKRINILILVFLLCILTACSNIKPTSQLSVAPEVVVKVSQDNSVNGYRTDSNNEEITNYINADDVGVGDVTAYDSEFCANKNSKVYHKKSCSSVAKMKEQNKYFADRDTLINNGYKPCGQCKP